MAVKIEKGGWILIFLMGLALVAYGLKRYSIIDFQQLFAKTEVRTRSQLVRVALERYRDLL